MSLSSSCDFPAKAFKLMNLDYHAVLSVIIIIDVSALIEQLYEQIQ